MVMQITLPDFTSQTAVEYKTNLDESIDGLAHSLSSFAPKESEPQGMEIFIDAAYTPYGVISGPWIVSDIGAPELMSRVDAVYFSPNLNDIVRLVGNEGVDPTPPEIPFGALPIALIYLVPGMMAITNESIHDIRPFLTATSAFSKEGYTYIVDPDGLYRLIIGRAGVDNRTIFPLHPDGVVQFQNADGVICAEITSAGDLLLSGNIYTNGDRPD